MNDRIPDSSRKLFDFVREKIDTEGNFREAESMAYMLLEHIFNINRNDIVSDRTVTWSSDNAKTLLQFIERINKNEPVQHILGKANFYGRSFIVTPNVLIPRGETEELVDLIIKEMPNKRLRVLDIGTGTGCIPITLVKERPGTKCFAMDFNPRALKIAKANAEMFDVPLELYLMDVLKEDLPIDHLDIIVSNPPYVNESERHLLKANVLEFEPHTALFVPDEDPLKFYDRIVELSVHALKPGGKLYFEINESYGNEVAIIFAEFNFTEIKIVKDIHGKDRFVRGQNAL